MSFLKRIHSIISVNINDLLNKVEDPEVAVRQMIRDMERGISEMRKNTATVMSSQNMTGKRLKRAIDEEATWQKNAEAAVKKGNDELAKNALQKKRTAIERADLLHKQLEDEVLLVTKLKSELVSLEDKIQEARTKLDTLIAKKRAVKTRKKLMESAEKWTGAAGDIISGFDAFDEFEDENDAKYSLLEAKEDLQKALKDEDIDEKFSGLKKEKEINEELAVLKKKMGG